ncbi:MAG: hypothetical protein MJZ34_00210 [Paludibacteraceae bacterium]|nr:hypothetical protein [Paludibacteraceae bacterium]
MKIRFHQIVIMLLMFFVSINMQAETVYPIQLNPQILPPYSTCLSDYTVGVSRFNVIALNRDNFHLQFNIIIRMTVKQGNSIRKTYVSQPMEIHSKGAQILELKDMFDEIRNETGEYCFEEGAYEFVVQAFDATNQNLPLSEPSSVMTYLNLSTPPICLFPLNGECIDASVTQNINFSWMESSAAAPSTDRKYELIICEVPELYEDKELSSTSMQRIVKDPSMMIFKKVVNGLQQFEIVNTSSLMKGYSYVWCVRVYNESHDDDKQQYFKNQGWSAPSYFKFKNCNPWNKEIKEEHRNDDPAPDLEVSTEDGVVTLSWTSDVEFDGYRVGYNVKDNQDAVEWTNQLFSKNESSWRITSNIAYDVTHVARIEGFKLKDKDTIYSNYSPSKDFMLLFKANNECKPAAKAISQSDPIDELKKGDIIDACGRYVRIKEVQKNGNGTFSGTGIVSLPIISNLTGIKVSFENISVNKSKQLTKGTIVTVSSDEPTILNANGAVNKQYAGSPTKLQKTKISSMSFTNEVASSGIVKVSNDKVVDSNGDVIGSIVSIGDIQDNPIDNKDVKVTFAAVEKDNPKIDSEKFPFSGFQIDQYYTNPGEWIAIEQGKSANIKAMFSNVSGEFSSENVDIYIASENDAVKVDGVKWNSTNECEFKVFAGTAEKHLNLFAMLKTNEKSKIVGRAYIQAMEHWETNLHLVPVGRTKTSVKVDAIKKKLETVYSPLGKYFNVILEDEFGAADGYNYPEGGMDVSENSFLSTESAEMKQLAKAYIEKHPEIEKNEDAYIFVCPSAKDKSVKGDMPRNERIGYVFSEANEFGTETDAWTIAHEIGHGLFDWEHSFEFGASKGSTTNIMDYNNGTDTKVWQWTVMDDHPSYTLPILEDAEDAQWTTDGHYYLFTYLSLLLGLPYSEAEQYGKWAEEPDSQVNPDGSMVENTTWLHGFLQQQNHALTGGYFGVELAATVYAIDKAVTMPQYIVYTLNRDYKRPVSDDCRAFLFHRFGDCFAHSNIYCSENFKVPYVSTLIESIDKYVYNQIFLSANDEYSFKEGREILKEQSIYYDSEKKKFVSTLSKEEFTRAIVSSIIYAKDISLYKKLNNNESTLEIVRKGILELLPYNQYNSTEMYGDDVNGCMAFSLGHAKDGPAVDVISGRPQLFLAYTKSAIDLLSEINKSVNNNAGNKAYKSVKDVVDWGIVHSASRLDGIFAFLVAFEKAKQEKRTEGDLTFSIPIKYLPGWKDEGIGGAAGFLYYLVDDIKNKVFPAEDTQADYLKDFLEYSKDLNLFPNLNLNNVDEIMSKSDKSGNLLTFTIKYKSVK